MRGAGFPQALHPTALDLLSVPQLRQIFDVLGALAVRAGTGGTSRGEDELRLVLTKVRAEVWGVEGSGGR